MPQQLIYDVARDKWVSPGTKARPCPGWHRLRTERRRSRPRAALVRLSQPEYAALKKAATARGMSMSSYLRTLGLAVARGDDRPASVEIVDAPSAH